MLKYWLSPFTFIFWFMHQKKYLNQLGESIHLEILFWKYPILVHNCDGTLARWNGGISFQKEECLLIFWLLLNLAPITVTNNVEVLTHIKHHSVPYTWITYPSIFLDRIQSFSIKIFLNGLGICWGRGFNIQWDLNVIHASYFKSASNPSIRFWKVVRLFGWNSQHFLISW